MADDNITNISKFISSSNVDNSTSLEENKLILEINRSLYEDNVDAFFDNLKAFYKLRNITVHKEHIVKLLEA